MLIRKDDHILFYGDSVTATGRWTDADKDGLGTGYAAICARTLAARYPKLNLTFTNAGIGGNRIYDLEDRLENDVIAVRPTVVSILIGINDTWRRYDSGVESPIPEFQACYRRILETLQEKLDARLVLMEPFVLPIPPDRKQWREDLDPRIIAVRELAWEFRTCYVPLDGIFASAACRQPMEELLPDGVHPSESGHALIAGCWIWGVTA